jgi:transcriptional regulator with XRE-family HTH domain
MEKVVSVMMNGQPTSPSASVASKIARLVEERGWNQEDFSRIANLNRQTVRRILQDQSQKRNLRNTTVSACAKALGLPVSDLKNMPLERLLPRMHDRVPAGSDETLRRLYEQATQPELRGWIDRNPDRAKHLDGEEMDKLLSLQGVGGPLTGFGVEHFVTQIERRRQLLDKVRTIAGTELVDVLEKVVELMYEKVQPYREVK